MIAAGAAALRPLPADGLALGAAESALFEDRRGVRLLEQVGALETRARPVSLDEVSPHVVSAFLAVEDKRFFSHMGFDPLATARAAYQNLTELRVVSGGSTLTQQLARLLLTERAHLAGEPTPARSLWQKVIELRLALRLERTFDKRELLAAFINRAPFGNTAVGIEAAAQRYFGVSARALSLAQAAYLAGLPQGPTYYDPIDAPERATARQAVVLRAMHGAGMITSGQLGRALDEEVTAALSFGQDEAPHAVLMARQWLREAGVPERGRVRLTVDARLQEEVRRIVADVTRRAYFKGARSAAVVVLDNRTGDVLAVVGAAFEDNPEWGRFNAATATRQPGSALKPFLYAAALERGFTAASLAADVARPYPDTWGIYMPENYDRGYHGPVRLREALAQSLNVATVDVLFRTGIDRVFDKMDDVGLKTLDRRPQYFGLGLALGSGGVRLIDLTNAYASLARGGLKRPWRIVSDVTADGAVQRFENIDHTRVIDEGVAFIIGDILADPNARIPQFGERSVLKTPYWTAVKTGTSKAYRDNWTIGYTADVTVGVWVGDPTGRKMRRMGGVEGAGPLWRKVMNHLTDYRSQRPTAPAGLVQARVCGLSGALATEHCRGGRAEWFIAGTEPSHRCDFHSEALVDPQNGRLVPSGCNLPGAVTRKVVVYPPPYDAWAEEHEEGRAERYTPRCPTPVADTASIALVSPAIKEAVRIDPDVPRDRQALPLQAVVAGAAGQSVTFLVDGETVGTTDPPHVIYWPVVPGKHRVRAKLEPAGPSSEEHIVLVY